MMTNRPSNPRRLLRSRGVTHDMKCHGVEPARIVPETVDDDVCLVTSPLFRISAQWFNTG